MARERFSEADESAAGGLAHAPEVSIRPAARAVRGVALLLHGGRAKSFDPVSSRQLSPARMIPFARTLQSQGAQAGLETWSLRNRVRGWNGPEMSPLHDARWALNLIHERRPGVPVYLLGHSMGGLTGLCVADDPQVRAVVALAPWLDSTTPFVPVTGKRVLIMHGDSDRWTSPEQSLHFARRALPVAGSVHYVSLAGAGHFMLRKTQLWHGLSVSYLLHALKQDTGAPIPARYLRRAENLLAQPEPLTVTF